MIFNYAPAALEIIKPEKEVHIKTAELQSLLIDISNLSIQYSKYILEKVLDPKEIENIKKQMDNRAEIGRKAIEKKRDNEEKAGK